MHLSFKSVLGFICTKDSDKWGAFHRGLDWGKWHPEGTVWIRLDPPKVTTLALLESAAAADQVAFCREYWRVNPGLPLHEAKLDYDHLRAAIEKSG